MGLFRKKKIYKVVWKYYSTSSISYTELVKAYDTTHAWEIIKREHSMAISLVSVEEVI